MSDIDLVPCPRCVDRANGGYCLLCSGEDTPGVPRKPPRVPQAMAVEYTLLELHRAPIAMLGIRELRNRYES